MVTIISHNDLDGLCSALMLIEHVKSFSNQPPIVWICQIPQALNTSRIARCDKIYVADLGISDSQIAILKSRCKEFVLIDHHDKYDNLPCATYQIIQKYKLTKYNRLGYLVDVYDRWLDDSPDWQEALKYNAHYWCLYNINKNGNVFYKHDSMEQYDQPAQPHTYKYIMERLLNIDNRNVRLYAQFINKYVTNAIEGRKELVDKQGNKLWVIPRQGELSYTSNLILKQYPSVKYVVILTHIDNPKLTDGVSIRTRKVNNFDVTKLPGIQGHKNAGGGTWNNELKNFINLTTTTT